MEQVKAMYERGRPSLPWCKLAPMFQNERIADATAALSAMSPADRPCVVCGIANPNHHAHLAPFNEEYHEYQPSVSPAGEVERLREALLEVRRKSAANFDRNGAAWEAYDRAVLDCIAAIEGLARHD